MNFCPNCGKQLEADARFCPGCGNAVAATQAEPDAPPAAQFPPDAASLPAAELAPAKKSKKKLLWLLLLPAALLILLIVAIAASGNENDRFKGIKNEDPRWVGFCDTMAWAIYGDTEKHGSGKQWEEGAKQAKSSLVACYATFRSEASSEDLYRYIRNAALTTLETPSEQTEHKEANALWQKYYMREETSPPDTLPNLEPTLLAFAFTIATNFNDLPATPGKPGEFVVKSGSEIDIFVVSDQQGKYWAYNTDTETMFPYAYYIGRPDLQADRETPHFYLFADRYDEAGNALYKASDGSLSQSAVVLLAMAALQVETDKTGAATTAPPQATTPADKPQGLATVSERMGLDKLTIPEGNYGSSAGNLRRWYTDQQICDAMTENEIEYWVGFGEAFEAEIYGGSGTWFESDEEVRGIHAAAPYIQEALRTADTGDTRENILKQAITEGEHLCGASLVDIAPGIAAYRVWIASQ